VRRFDQDDAIVHIWDRLIFGAMFRKWIAFRHDGDYAVSHWLLPRVLNDVSIARAYTMDIAGIDVATVPAAARAALRFLWTPAATVYGAHGYP
jgi:hypothetical protein